MGNGGVNIHAIDQKDGMNALLKLTRNYGHDNLIELVTPLLKRGIDVNSTDPNGWNALHNLCHYYLHENLVDLILLLKESNIDIKAKTKEGYTAISLMALENTAEVTWKWDAIVEILDEKSQEFSEVMFIPFFTDYF